MSEAPASVTVQVLNLVGRFLYRLVLAVVIVWVLGLIVGLFVGEGPGGGVIEIAP
ncbi:MAG: hypothetical protein IT201_06275 [Thermoleophilia bacterium]|nr:hypothetical protein [Thermoleophilia bacterium]